ncbi:MAG: MFS transporter [Chloroflexi bacterium]|nr:MFS transporter [Chloroflexota bacterium]
MPATSASSPSPANPRAFAVLGDRDFRLLWITGWLRNHARFMEVIILGWVVLELTDSPWRVGLLAFFRMIPVPLLGLASGVLSDRVDRKRVMVATEATSFVLMTLLFVLVATDSAEFWSIAIIALGMGIGWVVSFPARNSVIQDMVGTAGITKAMSLETATLAGSRMMGPLYGGLLLNFAGPTEAIFVLTVLYGLDLLLLWRIHIPPRQAVAHEPVTRVLTEGLRFAISSRLILAVILITIVANVLYFPYMGMLPVFARDVLGVGPALLGIMAAADGLGALIGSVFLASRRNIRSPGRIFVFGTILSMTNILLFTFSRTYGLSLAILLAAGLSFSGYHSMQTALVLLSASPEIRGRALGIQMMAIGTGPVGQLITGASAETWGAPRAVAMNCAVALVLMAVITVSFPAIRRKQTIPGQDADEAVEGSRPIAGGSQDAEE